MSGRVASMGRGIIQDVSARIIDQFSENLATMLTAAAREEPPRPEPEPAAAPAPFERERRAVGRHLRPAAPRAAEGRAEQAARRRPPRPSCRPPTLAGAVVAGRLQDPKVLAGALGAVFAIGYLIGRR